MHPDQTPVLHLNLDGSAEDNRNWSLIDGAVQQLFAQLGINLPQNAIVYIGTTAPASPVDGFLWFNTTDLRLYVYVSGTWLPAVPQYYLMAGAFAGQPTASLSLGLWEPALNFTLNANRSYARAKTPPTASAQCTLLYGGNPVMTATWPAGGVNATFAMIGGPLAVTPGMLFELTAPATADATFANLVWTIVGII